jgi:hypothetical protein
MAAYVGPVKRESSAWTCCPNERLATSIAGLDREEMPFTGVELTVRKWVLHWVYILSRPRYCGRGSYERAKTADGALDEKLLDRIERVLGLAGQEPE